MKSTSAFANTEQATSDLQIRLQVSEKKSERLSTALQDAKKALPDHIPIGKEKTVLAGTAKSKLQDELRSLRAKFKSCRPGSKKKLDYVTISYNESQTRLAQSEREGVQ